MLLWEILALCAEKPLSGMTDLQVEENLTHHYHADGFQLTPASASGCVGVGVGGVPGGAGALMARCWRREPRERPSFDEVESTLAALVREEDEEVVMF